MYIDINSVYAQIWTFEDPLQGIHVDEPNQMTLDCFETTMVTREILSDECK
jgi:hypothetical protein